MEITEGSVFRSFMNQAGKLQHDLDKQNPALALVFKHNVFAIKSKITKEGYSLGSDVVTKAAQTQIEAGDDETAVRVVEGKLLALVDKAVTESIPS